MKKEFSFKDRFENILMLGNGHVPAFLYCGEKPVLFDPGVSAFGPLYLEKIMQNLKDPSSLILALTHSHFDHCGAVSYLLRNIPGIKVAASEKAADVILRPNAVKLMEKLNQEYEKEMKDELKGENVSFEVFNNNLRLAVNDNDATTPLIGGMQNVSSAVFAGTDGTASHYFEGDLDEIRFGAVIPEPGILWIVGLLELWIIGRKKFN